MIINQYVERCCRCSSIHGRIKEKERELNKLIEFQRTSSNDLKQEWTRHTQLAQEIAHTAFDQIPTDFETAITEESSITNWILAAKERCSRFISQRGGHAQGRSAQVMSPLESIDVHVLYLINEQPQVPPNQIVEEMKSILASQGSQNCGIVGVVCDLAFVDNESESILYGKLCGNKIIAVILQDNRWFKTYYDKYRNANSFASFLSLKNVRLHFVENSDNQV